MNEKHLSIGSLMSQFAGAALLLVAFGAPAQSPTSKADTSPAAVVQRFVDAYNARKADPFVEPLADKVQVYNYPGQLTYEGKEYMRKRFAESFAKSPNVRCEIIKRIALGDTVIDQERITGSAQGTIEQITIYRVENGKITRIEALKPGK